jgi:hypothetical protein
MCVCVLLEQLYSSGFLSVGLWDIPFFVLIVMNI